jgi:hypothetical protein
MCREVSIRQLEQKAGVLEKAKEAAERRLRNDLAAERRQQAELKQQMKQLQVGCCCCCCCVCVCVHLWRQLALLPS